MNFSNPDPAQVILQVQVQNPDGTPKLSLLSAVVRVYHLSMGIEVINLTSTPLVQVGSSSVWRYLWSPSSLPTGNYFAEYTLVDNDGYEFVGVEKIDVFDVSKQVDLEFVKQVEQGRWKVVSNQMIFYADNGTTPLMIFNLYDKDGKPTMESVYERVPV